MPRKKKTQSPPSNGQQPAPEITSIKELVTPKTVQGLKVGKPQKLSRTAGGFHKSASYSPYSSGNTVTGSGGNFYSPELSTDFLELPQSIDERRNYYRFFYENEPFIAQAIDLHTELPLSKIRLDISRKAKSRELAEKSLKFCEGWSRRVHLLQRLLEILHDYFLLGEVFIFCEDGNPEMPRNVREYPVREVDAEGGITEYWKEYDDADNREVRWLNRYYKGWTDIQLIPPEQVKLETYTFTREKLIEFIPDSKTKALVELAKNGDPTATEIASKMIPEIVDSLVSGKPLRLNTDPDAGSFVFYLANKKAPYEPRGTSILQRCLRSLVLRDKIRQSLTSITSRHMTPYRLVWGENLDENQLDDLRDQVDLALQDPDYSIVTNYQVNWEEMGADQRVPDWSWIFDLTDRQLYSGLGVTESLLSGESSYSGDRINLEVINTRYMLIREMLQEMVEDYIFKPMCRRMGFVEEDEWGNLEVITPRLSFTRLALRDNAETFDALFNLYQKGSLDIDIILELLNIDPVTVREKLQRDLFTVNDASFNEVLRAIYGRVGDSITDNSDVVEKIAQALALKFVKPVSDAGDRFGG
jgi:hypothetical protein